MHPSHPPPSPSFKTKTRIEKMGMDPEQLQEKHPQLENFYLQTSLEEISSNPLYGG